jgi:uncharacterized protein
MAITIEKSFSVDASPDAVWAFLTDPHKVADCLPGAAITEQIDESTFAGSMTVKVGPVSSKYKGQIKFDRLDPAARVAELSGRGQDVRGKGGADMKMTSRLVATPDGGTEATVTSEVNVTGILAQFGRGMIQDVSDQMFETFTTNMRRQLAQQSGPPTSKDTDKDQAPPSGGGPGAAPPEDEAFDALAFGAQVGKRTVTRWLRTPAFWIVLIVIIVLLILIF